MLTLSIFTNIGLVILKIFLLLFILGIIILVHELGHFMWAKKFGVHIYEFAIGMGPKVFSWKGKKDKIPYSIRAIPIGGFVQLAGEVYENDDKIPKDKFMCNKPWYQRVIVFGAGVFNNFVLALVILIVYGAIWGGGSIKPEIDYVVEGSAAQSAGLKANDIITKINGYSVGSWDKAQIILYYKNSNEHYTFEVKHEDGKIEEISITPQKIYDEDLKTDRKVFGMGIKEADTSSILKSIGYGFQKFGSIISSMVYTIWGLITSKISLSSLSGPVGIYEVVGAGLSIGISYFVYILAFLSLNVGFINILPFPAFDGGHIFFLIIEKIKGSPINAKFENICHLVGFALLILLMIVVTINDIIKLF